MNRPPTNSVYLSVVIPAMNEEENLPLLAEQLEPILSTLPYQTEVWFIDDGSTDRTFAVMTELCRSHPQWHAIKFRRNFGKTAALVAGFERAKGEILITMDADLQDDPQEIPRFLEKLEEGYDLVTGWKYPRRDPLSKTFPSRVINRVVNMMMKTKLHDINCGFKAYRRPVIDEIEIHGDLHRYIPVLAEARGFHQTEIQIHHLPRKFGRSKYGPRRFFEGFFDLLTVFFLTRFAVSPLRIFGLPGMISLIAGMGISGYMAWLRFVCDQKIGDRPLFETGIQLLLIGIELLFTGFLGEMIVVSHSSGKTRPFAVVAESGGDPTCRTREHTMPVSQASTSAATCENGRAEIP